MTFRTGFYAWVLTVAMSLPAPAVPLYNQPFLNDLGYASQNDTSAVGGLGNFSTVYDNFTLVSNSTVTDLTWIGGYFEGGVPGSITGWTIQFYADDTLTDGFGTYSVPGAVLATESFSGLANETLRSGLTYLYSHTLIKPLTLQGGVQYWLSIVPDLAYDPNGQWDWKNGSGGDERVVQRLYGSILPEQSPDAAFSLTGTVPELDGAQAGLPFGLVGCLLGVLAGRRRVLS